MIVKLLVLAALVSILLRAFNAPVRPHLGWIGVALLIVYTDPTPSIRVTSGGSTIAALCLSPTPAAPSAPSSSPRSSSSRAATTAPL